MKTRLKVAFDIDETLWQLRTDANGDRHQAPNYELITVLKWFYDNGHTVYVWSAGGIGYAQTIVRNLGLDRMVTVIMKGKNPEIDIAFDDQTVELASVNIKVRSKYDENNLQELT